MIGKISNIIKDHFNLLSYVITGKGTPSDRLMKKFGIKPSTDLIETAYNHGKSQVADDPVTPKQKGILSQLKEKSSSLFTSLCQKVVTGVQYAVCKESITDQRLNQKTNWKSKIKQLIDKDQIKSAIKRIVNTEVWDANIQGKTDGILENSGKNTKVRIVPYSDACPKCKQLYLNSDGTPKTFDMKQLMNGGTEAVMPPCHPHCRCKLEMVGDTE